MWGLRQVTVGSSALILPWDSKRGSIESIAQNTNLPIRLVSNVSKATSCACYLDALSDIRPHIINKVGILNSDILSGIAA